MSPSLPGDEIEELRFPRVSGDEPVILEAATRDAEFSPRERG